LLISLFGKEGRLPDKIIDLYRRGCLRLCEEANPLVGLRADSVITHRVKGS